jgi:hypothetical protein
VRRLPQVRVRPRAILLFVVAGLATAPAWVVAHPPLQDLPFHLATLRIIHSFHDAAYGFADTYQLSLFKTEYMLYYVVGDLLAYVSGVKVANVILMCLYLGGMPLSMAALLRALGRDERLALFVVPLSVNVMFCLGLLPFVFGFPLMLLALATAVRHFEMPTRRTGIVLGVLTLLTFFAHVMPFVLFGVGCIAVFPWTRPHRWVASAAPLVPGLPLVAWWLLGSPAGSAALHGDDPRAQLVPQLLGQKFPFAPGFFDRWSLAIFRDESNERWAMALALVALAALGLSAAGRDEARRVTRGWVLLPLGCVAGYLTFGDKLGDVWLFGQRFALPALFTSIPLLRMPTNGRGWVVTAAALGVAVGSTMNVCKHFVEFDRHDAADFEDAIAAMEPRKHVAGLIYDPRGASVMSDTFAPFLHYVSYYQLEKGGVVQFSYTGFPHWPVQYREDRYPPPGTLPRHDWEWLPEQVPMTELHPYYDYVLVRGGPFNPPPGTFHVTWQRGPWTVWERD